MADEPEVPDEADEPHRADGLDLARALLRGAMGAPEPASRPARKRVGEYGERRPRRLRAGEAQLSGAHPDGRDPQALGSELDKIIGERGWALDLRIRGVFARWAELVGPEIGEHSTPESLKDGVLVVRAHSTAWATQLKLLASGVVRRLNEELGDGTVTVVEVLGPTSPSWKHGLKSVKGRGPRDTYG